MLKHLEDEGILFFDLPHLIEKICARRPRSIFTPPSDTTGDVCGNPIGQRELDVLREVAERAQLEDIESRSVFIVGVRRRIEPGMAQIITQSQHQRLAPFLHHWRVKRKTAQLSYEVRERWFKDWAARSVLRDDVFINFSDNRANNIFGGLIVVFHPREHLQVANDQSL